MKAIFAFSLLRKRSDIHSFGMSAEFSMRASVYKIDFWGYQSPLIL
ncbi:hypothetical protein CLOSTMETH_02639 [[Clostridium] methylpentosum DSM 5476]|uniref:Uncharacterized protein n=1 Tax=[Clostridium] methylpentosum DSM 5476 TaxID=537013 RepID=C0EFJ7_9FIRM|nr:hypothetical protein CLOSTMETH_02639 [[Clostridium] methylpentosum DSM 5476]